MSLADLAAKAGGWGYQGLELACWGDHFEVGRALAEQDYCQKKLDLLEKYGLDCQAISNHLVGQMVLDLNDARTDAWAPPECRGDSDAKSAWAAEEMKRTAQAARKLGVTVVNGFTGSSIWHLLYSFPPVPKEMIDAGYDLLAERWNPILDVFAECGVRFGLEVHPTEIAFDIPTAERALRALEYRPEFGFNFDPSHLHWQGIDPVQFLRTFPDRIYHVHIKDAAITLDGRSGILGSHLDFGDARRGWDFRSPGHGGVDFEAIIRALNDIGYAGPLSVEWEDSGMDREYGAQDACQFVERIDFAPSGRKFDDAFHQEG
jgi:sugar phosphate isomerase/epimerase